MTGRDYSKTNLRRGKPVHPAVPKPRPPPAAPTGHDAEQLLLGLPKAAGAPPRVPGH